MKSSTALLLMFLGALLVATAGGCLAFEVGGPPLVPAWVAMLLASGVLAVLGLVGLAFGAAGSGGATSSNSSSGRFRPYEAEDREVDGHNCQVFFKPYKSGKHGHPSSLMISMRANLPTSLQFNAENWFDRLCKALGIAREHQTGDARFDDLVYVRTPLEAYAERYLADAAKREAVVALKQEGFTEIKVGQTEAQAHWVGFSPATHDHEGLIDDVARRLITLTSNLPKPDAQLDEPEWRIDWHGPLWLFLLLYAISFASAFWFQPVQVGDLMQVSLLVYAVSWFGLAWFAAFLLRGHSTSHDQWIVLVAVGVVLMLLGSIGTVAAVNALGDGAKPAERRVTVCDKRISRSKKSTTYYLCVPSWNRPGENVEFSVSSSEYNRAVTGRSEFVLVIGPGALGIEWLHSKQLNL